jgi:septal ring factor EnvC (AmiA/AmiB activator)
MSALFALFLAASTPSPSPSPSAVAEATASPAVDDRLRRVQERKQALERELKRLRGEEKSLLGEVEELEVLVRLRTAELREAQLELQRNQAQLEITGKRARELEASVEATRPQLAAHARALYKLGELSYLRLLLSVDRPSDFFRGYRFVSALARRDNERMAGFRADLTALAETRSELERRMHEATALRSQLETTRRSLDAQRQKKTELLTAIVEKKETHAAYVEELENAETQLRRLFDGLGEGDVSVPVSAFRGQLPWPTEGKIRSGFGRHKHPRFDTYTVQNGVEIEAAQDGAVRAVYEGTVVFADRFRGYGLMVVLDHGGKHHSLYAHLAEATVAVGQKLAAGDVLGTVGATSVEGPGLYFEMRFQGRPEDPADWLKK